MYCVRTINKGGIVAAILGLLLPTFHTSSMDARAARVRNADDLLVVDCLLPGQIRKLGRLTTYITPRRPTKTTGQDCEIRGGEYVAYDRADYATALRIWLPRAKEGDPTAQTYVGEIYEKGLGLQPDYELAANWYRKAAEAGHTRSQINLGHLYEKGLGVKQDPAEALNWYRKASGMEEVVWLDPGTINANRREMEALRDEVEQRKRETGLVRDQLQQARRQREKAQRELEKRQGEFQAQHRRLEQARKKLQLQKQQAPSAQIVSQLASKETELAEMLEEIGHLRGEIKRVSGEANRYRVRLASLSDKDQELHTLRSKAEQRRGETTALQRLLSDTEDQLRYARGDLDRQRAEAESQRQLLEKTKKVLEDQRQKLTAGDNELAKLENTSKQREAELARQQTEMARLREEVRRVETETNRYRIQLQKMERQQKARLAGPTIEMIDPSLVKTRGVPRVKVPSDITQRQIIGRVTAPAGLRTLLVNNRRAKANDRGVFQVQVSVQSTPVTVVATDRQGKRATVEFVLEAGSKSGPSASAKSKKVPRVNFGPYYAIIIGNNKYARLPKLDTAVNDAHAVAKVLRRKYGFNTTVLIDATRYEILSALNEAREKLTEKDNLLIYYAGHGELDEANTRGHWLPVDAEPGNPANWISNVSITDILNVITAKQILLVADSCYSGALTRSALTRLGGRDLTDNERMYWLKTMATKRSRTVFTSGGLKPVMDAGGAGHSVFAKAFLDVLDANGDIMAGQRLYREVAARVAYAASKARFEQAPEYAPIKHTGHEGGDFVFVPKT